MAANTTPYVRILKNGRDEQGHLMPGPQLLAEAPAAFHNNDNMAIYYVGLHVDATNCDTIDEDSGLLTKILTYHDTLVHRRPGSPHQLIGYPDGDELLAAPAYANRIGGAQKLVSQEEKDKAVESLRAGANKQKVQAKKRTDDDQGKGNRKSGGGGNQGGGELVVLDIGDEPGRLPDH